MTREFGYFHATKEYKVLALWDLLDSVVCEVLTVRQNSWRRIDGIPCISQHDTVSSVYVNGSIYLLCTNNYHFQNDQLTQTILEFNVGSEKFRIVETTSYIRDMPRDYLMELDGRLCMSTHLTEDKRSIKMRILYDHVVDKESKTISSNFDWVEAETLSLPLSTELNSIRQIPGTKLFIIGSINDKGFYHHYIWNNRSSNIDIEISSYIFSDETHRTYELGFNTFTPTLLLVN